MSIYTPLIEQIKKEIEESRVWCIKHGFSLISLEWNELVLKEKQKLETLQLAEKMHLEFVEELNNLNYSEIGFLEGGCTSEEFNKRITQEINRLSNQTQRRNNKDYDGFTIEPKTQKGVPIDALTKAMMTKEAIASCALDGETQCGTIEPETQNSEAKK